MQPFEPLAPKCLPFPDHSAAFHDTTALRTYTGRWVNLWLTMPASMTPDSCVMEDPEAQMDDGVFFGNTSLVFGILLGIFLVHVTVVSAVEAYWLAQVREKKPCHASRKYATRCEPPPRTPPPGISSYLCASRRCLSNLRTSFFCLPENGKLVQFS